MRLWVEAEVLRLTNLRAAQLRRRGTPGPEGSVAKISFSSLNHHISALCVSMMGPEGTLYPAGYAMRRPEEAGRTGARPAR